MNCFCKDETQSAEHLSDVSMISSDGLGDKKNTFLIDVIVQSSDALDHDLDEPI
jgi:hypothetical protein